MGLNPSNYGLKLNRPNLDWLNTNDPTSPLASSGGRPSMLGSIGGGAASGAAMGSMLGPIGAAAGGVLGAIGSGLSGMKEQQRYEDEQERLKREEEFRKKQAAQSQFNTERSLGIQGMDMLAGIRSNASRNKGLLARDIARLRG